MTKTKKELALTPSIEVETEGLDQSQIDALDALEVDVEAEQLEQVKAETISETAEIDPAQEARERRRKLRKSGGEKFARGLCKTANKTSIMLGLDPLDADDEMMLADDWDDVGEFMTYKPKSIWSAGAVAIFTTLMIVGPQYLAIIVKRKEMQAMAEMMVMQRRANAATNVTPDKAAENTTAQASI